MPKPVDLNKPLPDEAHEAIRLGVVQALSDLADSFLLVDVLFELSDTARTDIGISQADLGDSLLLVDVLFLLLDQAVADATTAAAERAQLRADYDALTARVIALEALTAPPLADTVTTTPDAPGGPL